jgi:hypothetical protein
MASALHRLMLQWVRGKALPPPPTALYLSFHENGSEVSAVFGGRILVPLELWSEPVLRDGYWCVENLQQVNLPQTNAAIRISAAGVWSEPVRGMELMAGRLETPVDLGEHEILVFARGSLVLRGL